MEIKKIEKSDFVMFPRMQHRGLQFRHVERDAYRAELRHVEGHGDYWLLHQQSKPHVVAHVQLPRRRLSLTISLAGAWARTIGVSTSRVIFPSSASLLATMPLNSPPSTQISSVNASMPLAMLLVGGMSMVRIVFY